MFFVAAVYLVTGAVMKHAAAGVAPGVWQGATSASGRSIIEAAPGERRSSRIDAHLRHMQRGIHQSSIHSKRQITVITQTAFSIT